MVSFVNSKAGTFRTAGGKLNAQAGTIEALDSIIAKYITNKGLEDIEKASADIKAAAVDVKDKSVEYYLRALTKLTGNPEYAMKEHKRLAGLLKKTGLAPEKIDEMQKRVNILSNFLFKNKAAKDEL